MIVILSLLAARANATTYSANATGYLDAGTQGSRYTTWFGVYDAARYNTAKTHFAENTPALP